MTDLDERLGGRLPLLDRADLGPEQQRLWERIDRAMAPWAAKVGFESKDAEGRFIGPFNPMLRSPAVAMTFLQLQSDEEKHTDLSSRIRQVVILSVGSLWQSPYELYAHKAAARHAGLSETCVEALGPVEIRDFIRRLFVIQARDGPIRFDRCAICEDGAVLFGEAARSRPHRHGWPAFS